MDSSKEEQVMCSPIPGTDLEIVVRRIRGISRRMDGRTLAPRRHRPISRWQLSGQDPHVRRQLDVGGSPLPYAPRSPASPPPAAIADLPFAIAAAVSPARRRSTPARPPPPRIQSPAVLAIPVARVAPSPAIIGPSMATGSWTPPPRPPPPRTASAAVRPVLSLLQALPSLLSHSPESPYVGELELAEMPQPPPAVPPEYSGPCPDHEPEIPPWGTAVDEAVFDECVVCGESGRHLQIQCLRCQRMPGCCQCLPMATSQTPYLEFLRCPLCRFEGVSPIQVRPPTTTTATTTSSTAAVGFLDPNQWPFY